MDSDCWKCKQTSICLPAKDADLLDFVSIEKAQEYLVRNWFIWEWMDELNFWHWFVWIYLINISNFASNSIFYKYVQILMN